MSQNVAEGNCLFLIWSNENLDWDYWRGAVDDDYSTLTEDERYQLMENLNSEYLDDERRNLDIQVGAPIIIIADIGKWDGRHTGYRVLESGRLSDCLYTELDGVTWYVDEKGDFRLDGYHHDGHNYYLYRKFKNGISPSERDDFECKILDHTLTQEDIDSATERLGDDISRVYGFSLPGRAIKERSTAR